MPVARVRSLQHQLPGLSMGEGILETRSGGYQPIGERPAAASTLAAQARSTATRGWRRWQSAGRPDGNARQVAIPPPVRSLLARPIETVVPTRLGRSFRWLLSGEASSA